MIQILHENIDSISRAYFEYVHTMPRKITNNVFIKYLFEDGCNLEKYVLCLPNDLKGLIIEFESRFPNIDLQSTEWRRVCIYMKGQYEKVRFLYLPTVLQELNLSVCPYCNRHYIFSVGNSRKVSAQFDHFYSKVTYPYLALSFYNLIPCCPDCNRAKGEKDVKINPYAEGFDTNGQLEIDSLLNCVLGKPNWDVVFNADDRCRTNIEVFALDELYRYHKDVAYEIVCKAIANESGYLKKIVQAYGNMGLDIDTIYRILWGYYLGDGGLSKRPLSKLTADILKQLGVNKL